ncbi:sigma-70 family RNA polymerase sigma factor [Cohnella kolymensis]|uniref:sigma-70 family RNA polymerase sigma factor n=1 Tax=Cohnella kolymensis TaxID=1590652 RepID=UPI000698885C|nr:sigma-70 family RNA polymerase sigma factor [Cohnella kolymensis]
MSDLSWSTDVQLAVAGDRDAFARLIRTMEKEMYRLAWSLLHRDEDCADAIQETILKAYRSLPSLREPAYFRTWLFRILIRECQQTYRRRKRIIPFDNLPESGEVAAGADMDLREAVNRLREPLRTLVKLHYYADLPLNVIAVMLNVSEGTLKSRLHRARRQLLKWLAIPDERKMGYERR